MRLSIGFLHSFSLRHVKRARKANSKGGTSLITVKLMPPWVLKSLAFHVCLLPVNRRHVRHCHKLFDRRGLYYRDSKLSLLLSFAEFLPAQTESIHYFVITLDVGPLKIVEQTSTLRDHLQQAAPRMVILFMGFEVLREIVDTLAEKRNLNLG